MNYILMDIKKFLKKIENGQMEIEAGQWELHKDITNLKNTVQELKQLKKDLQQMKMHGLKQTGLIKELQLKLNALEQIRKKNWPLSLSDTSEEYQKVRKKLGLDESVSKGNKKKKSHIIRSEEILEIMTEESNKKTESPEDCRSKSEKPKTMTKETKQKGQGDSSQPFRKTPASSISQKPYSPSRDHSILQRYLQDSAKYIDRETSQMSYVSSGDSSQNSSKNQASETAKRRFWGKNEGDDPTRSKLGEHYHKGTGNPLKNKQTTLSIGPEKLPCPICPKKCALRSGFLRHKKKLQRHSALHYCEVCGKGFSSKNHLKKHDAIHQKISKSCRGYRCSYCDKVYSLPEKLTAHMKNCRIITKTHCHRK